MIVLKNIRVYFKIQYKKHCLSDGCDPQIQGNLQDVWVGWKRS